MDKTYLKIFAVLLAVSGAITTIASTVWLNTWVPIKYWTLNNLWHITILSNLLMWCMMLLGVGLIGVAAYLHRKAKI